MERENSNDCRRSDAPAVGCADFEPKESSLDAGQVHVAALAAGAGCGVQGFPATRRCSSRESGKPFAGACSSQSMTRPPMVRGWMESIVIHGCGSSGRGFHPGRPRRRQRSKSGSVARRAYFRRLRGYLSLRSRRRRSTTCPCRPRPPRWQSPSNPASLSRPPLEGPQANSMSRLSTVIFFQRDGGCRSFATCRQTFWPGRIDQFQLEIVHRPRAAQAKFYGVLLRHGALHGAPGDNEAAAAFEIEIHAQRRSAPGEHRAQGQLRIARNDGLPLGQS